MASPSALQVTGTWPYVGMNDEEALSRMTEISLQSSDRMDNNGNAAATFNPCNAIQSTHQYEQMPPLESATTYPYNPAVDFTMPVAHAFGTADDGRFDPVNIYMGDTRPLGANWNWPQAENVASDYSRQIAAHPAQPANQAPYLSCPQSRLSVDDILSGSCMDAHSAFYPPPHLLPPPPELNMSIDPKLFLPSSSHDSDGLIGSSFGQRYPDVALLAPTQDSIGHQQPHDETESWSARRTGPRRDPVRRTHRVRTDRSGRDRTKDEFLVQGRRRGLSYKEIRAQGEFEEAESTLRGRYRALIKPKEARVRKPEWPVSNINILQQIVREQLLAIPGWSSSYVSYCDSDVLIRALNKLAWKEIADSMARHGCYRYGNTTVKKKYFEISGLEDKANI